MEFSRVLEAVKKNEDKMEFSQVLQAIKANFNDKYEEYRKKWGGGIMGSKSQAITKAKERVLAKEAAQRMNERVHKRHGALNGYLDIHHDEKRFCWIQQGHKSLDVDVHLKYIYEGLKGT
ncbi:60S ribosomal protein L7a-2-like protein [Tanacetum coccineum]